MRLAKPHLDIGLFTNDIDAHGTFWRERNGCSEQTEPPIPEVHDAVAGTPESHGCASYVGCDPGYPVTWCEHSEGGYDDSTHGWPLFGGDEIWAFVQAI